MNHISQLTNEVLDYSKRTSHIYSNKDSEVIGLLYLVHFAALFKWGSRAPFTFTLCRSLTENKKSAWFQNYDQLMEAMWNCSRVVVLSERTAQANRAFLGANLTKLQMTTINFAKAAGYYSKLGDTNPTAIDIMLEELPRLHQNTEHVVQSFCSELPESERIIPQQSGCMSMLILGISLVGVAICVGTRFV